MRDIVERLRESAKHSRLCGWSTHALLDEQAVDEIERLQAALISIKCHLYTVSPDAPWIADCREIAKRALNRKEGDAQ